MFTHCRRLAKRYDDRRHDGGRTVFRFYAHQTDQAEERDATEEDCHCGAKEVEPHDRVRALLRADGDAGLGRVRHL